MSFDTQRLLAGMGHQLGKPHEANHVAAILIGPSPRLGGEGPVRFHGANDPRRRSGLAKGP